MIDYCQQRVRNKWWVRMNWPMLAVVAYVVLSGIVLTYCLIRFLSETLTRYGL